MLTIVVLYNHIQPGVFCLFFIGKKTPYFMICYITFSFGINVGLMNDCFICCFDFIFTIKATATVLIGVNVFVLLTYTFFACLFWVLLYFIL